MQERPAGVYIVKPGTNVQKAEMR